MITNSEIKLIQSLDRKKNRKNHQTFVVEGVKMITELIDSDFETLKVYGLDDTFKNHQKFEEIKPADLQRITHFKNSNSALALVQIPDQSKVKLSTPSILLENINDPGNLGTIIRTADWFGIEQIICSPESVDCFNPKVVSATMGAIFRTKVIYQDLAEFLNETELESYGTLLDGNNISKSSLSPNAHLVFGSESHGLSEEISSLVTHKVSIPKTGASESLNLGISVGIFCALAKM